MGQAQALHHGWAQGVFGVSERQSKFGDSQHGEDSAQSAIFDEPRPNVKKPPEGGLIERRRTPNLSNQQSARWQFGSSGRRHGLQP
jgi:hypothetical protein